MVTQEELKKLLHYDPDTGVFRWLKSGKGRRLDLAAGTVWKSRDGKRYFVIKIDQKRYYAHRLSWLYVTGKFPDDEIDHIDGNGLNNKLENIRAVTRCENNKNMRKPSNNISGIIGVSWFKRDKCWRAVIRINGCQVHLGLFKTIQEATDSRRLAEIKHGFHKNHGSDRPL